MRKSKGILIGFLLISFFGQAQLQPLNLHYIERIDHSTDYFSYSNAYLKTKVPDSSCIQKGFPIESHSSILPLIPSNGSVGFLKSPLSLNLVTRQNKSGVSCSSARIYPLTDLRTGGQIANGGKFLYNAGLGAALDISLKRFYLTAKFLPYVNAAPYVADSLQTNFDMDAGGNRALTKELFYRGEAFGIYRPNRFFTFLGGIGKNFFGEGYRSLLLSDNGASNPFAKIETTFGPVKYVNLYQMWKDNTVNPADKTLDHYKYSATHYLSWNVTREFNFSVFESVVWQSNDTLLNRGFDANYLNPIVFYRPVEYSTGSADNVLLGMNTSCKIDHHNTIYAQLILDEFLLSQIKARSRWWGNKYGFQFGYKSDQFLTINNLYFQTEFNVTRPFTYSHKNSAEAYGNMNGSVAHPMGANFWEVLSILSYKSKKIRITSKMDWIAFGADTNATSYGQNLFVSYSLRAGDYNQKIMQGLRTNVFNTTLSLEYPVISKIGLYLNFTYNYRMHWTKYGTNNQNYILVGIRSRIWNRYTDY